ncbi:MAG: GTPase HflX [Anaerolineaceae bacterium]|nr:GTPase HflX [Anaerolineaceae bacterium]
MTRKISEPTTFPKERAFLVGIELRGEQNFLSMDDSLLELSLLADTAGLNVIGTTTQRLNHPNSNTFIGSGKVEEISALVEELSAELLIFDVELSPRHLRELEQRFGENIRIIDRTALILDIFAQHAHTREGSLQVELAQYEYRLPRLTRAWTHLARQAGGGGGRAGSVGGVGLRGPGETQLEVDRREIRKRIAILKSELEKVRAHRTRHRLQRQRSQIPVIALVGYTNAGKSTLLNALASSDVLVANQLFATLDPTTRRVTLPKGHTVLITDTVGFIQKLPTQLVAAFRATLEEINEADLLIHVVDCSHPNALAQWQSVNQTLREIHADNIPTINVLNKMDLIENATQPYSELAFIPENYPVSALKKKGLKELTYVIESLLFESMVPVHLKIPYSNGQAISLFHDQGQVTKVEHTRGHIIFQGFIPARLLTSFQPYFAEITASNQEE